VRAHLRVLGQRLSTDTTHLGAQPLPAELAECVGADGEGDRFGVAEFYRRVAERQAQGCGAPPVPAFERGPTCRPPA